MRRKTPITRTDARLARRLARLSIAALALTLIPADFDAGARAKAIRTKRAAAAPYVAAATGPSAVAANDAAETRGRMAPAGPDQGKPTALPPASKDNGPLAAALGALAQAKPAPDASDGLHTSRVTAYKAAMAESMAATDAVARAVALAEARAYLADESRSVTDDVIARADSTLGLRQRTRTR